MAINAVIDLLLRLADAWFPLALLLMLWGAVGGFIGRGAGFANLFRDDQHVVFVTNPAGRLDRGRWRQRRPWSSTLAASPAFWSHLGLSVLGGVAWLGAARDGGALSGWGALVAALVIIAGIGIAAHRTTLRRPRLDLAAMPPGDVRAELARCALGALVGAVFVALLHMIAQGLAGGLPGFWGAPIVWTYLGVLASVAAAFTVPYLVAGLAIVAFALALVALVGLVDAVAGAHGEIAAIILFGLLVWGNGAWFKGRIPGLPYAEVAAKPREADNPNDAEPLPSNPRKIDLVAPLEAWKARTGQAKPVLVLLATSGGAYRASFWTALVLDRIAAEAGPGGRFAGLPDNIRLIAGASGGMVAGAYFTALSHLHGRPPARLADAIAQDTVDYQRGADVPGGGDVFRGRRRRIPIPRDSLSAVVQQFIRRDLPLAFWPGRRLVDRGVMLENQWLTLRRPFGEIAASEAQGLCPSIVFSPMLIETGSVAFVSNLDLTAMRELRLQPHERTLPPDQKRSALNRHSVEVFDAFPAAQDTLTLATAVRLNATFPYVSPALSLPVVPGRRVVDSGYYDNYGGDVLSAWLTAEPVRRWVMENCAGVAIIQVRAFAHDDTEAPAGRVARALQGVTSPPEGLFSARAASQLLRNNQQLTLVEQLYEQALGDRTDRCTPFIRRFAFEAYADASMSWYLPDGELESLRRLLPYHPDFSVKHAENLSAVQHPPGSRAAAQRAAFEAAQARLAGQLDSLADFWARGCTL